MAEVKKSEIFLLVALMLGLFALAIVTAVTYIGLDNLKSVACSQADSTHVYSDGVCQESSTNTTAVTTTALTQIGNVETAVTTVVSLIGLVVIVLIFAIVIKVALRFRKSGSE